MKSGIESFRLMYHKVFVVNLKHPKLSFLQYQRKQFLKMIPNTAASAGELKIWRCGHQGSECLEININILLILSFFKDGINFFKIVLTV